MELFRSNRNKLLLILIVGIASVVVFRLIPIAVKSNDIGNYVGIAALFITAWQFLDARESKIEGAIAAIRKELENAIYKVEKHGDLRDSFHDQQLVQIQRQTASLLQQSESHQEDVRRLYNYIFENKDKLAEYGATLAVLSKQGEIILAVGNMRSEILKLQGEVERVKAQMV